MVTQLLQPVTQKKPQPSRFFLHRVHPWPRAPVSFPSSSYSPHTAASHSLPDPTAPQIHAAALGPRSAVGVRGAMACLAISLQPVNGPDILLQTRSWFPVSRALAAVSAFRLARLHLARGKQQSAAAAASSSSASLDAIGDDPLAAGSGQLVVGVESQYRVVYRLVNSIYVLGVTTAGSDHATQNLRVAFYSVFSAFCLVEVELIGKHIQNSRTTSAMKHISTSARSSPSIRCGGSFVLVRIR